MRILITAEEQGFGPSANAINILHMMDMEETEFHYIGAGTSYEFFKNLGLSVRETSQNILENIEVLKQYDCLFSVMNSSLAILAKYLGLKVIYVDLIFWLFELDKDFLQCKKEAQKLLAYDLECVQNLIQHKNRAYNQHFIEQRTYRSILAHLLADLSIIEEFVPCSDMQRNFINKNAQTIITHPILDRFLYDLKKETVKKNKRIMASLGGMTTQNHYSILMNAVFSSMSEIEVYGSSKVKKSVTLPPAMYLKKVNEHETIIAQPGFATLYEMIFLDCLPIILPPQNVGQYRYVQFLKQFINEEQFIDWEIFFQKKTNDPWQYMKHVQAEMEHSSQLAQQLKDEIAKKIDSFQNDMNLTKAAIGKQKLFINKIMNSSSVYRAQSQLDLFFRGEL